MGASLWLFIECNPVSEGRSGPFTLTFEECSLEKIRSGTSSFSTPSDSGSRTQGSPLSIVSQSRLQPPPNPSNGLLRWSGCD
jgi:hypothetical protein